MNLEEILKLPAGRELDGLVAEKIFGFKLCEHELAQGDPRCIKCRRDTAFIAPPREYSTFDGLAISIPQKLTFFSFACWRAEKNYNSTYDIWVAKFKKCSLPIARYDYDESTYTGRGETFALAVCRAGLFAVMSESGA